MGWNLAEAILAVGNVESLSCLIYLFTIYVTTPDKKYARKRACRIINSNVNVCVFVCVERALDGFSFTLHCTKEEDMSTLDWMVERSHIHWYSAADNSRPHHSMTMYLY